MSKDQNIAAQAHAGELVAAREFDRLGEVFAVDIIDHDPASAQAPGVEGVQQFWRGFEASFPDFRLDVDVLTADEDHVTIVYLASGTHQGDYMGIAATGKRFTVRGVQVAKFSNAMITERWGSSDGLGLLSQLGVSLPPAPDTTA